MKERITNPDAVRVAELGQRSETVRRANLAAIVRELHARGPQSRSALVARTGLTRSAIRGLIGELAFARLVVENAPTPLGTPGRPSPMVRLRHDRAVALALEIAVDSLAAAIVGAGGTVIARTRIERERGHTSVEEICADLAVLATEVLASRPRGSITVGIGVAMVGVVRRDDGLVASAPNLGWTDVPLGRRLATALRTRTPVFVANEADLGALAEHRRGAAVDAKHVVYISGEVGVGGGIIVDGRPLTGVAGYGGEIGHFPVNPNGIACHCGAVGCWETEVGERALLRVAGHPIDGGSSAVEAVLAEAAAGAPAALAALDSVGRWLGTGLAGLVNLFNPELVVLGGLFGRIQPFVAETLDRELARRAMAAPRGLVRVVPASLGVDAPLLGAAELALEPLLADPAAWFGRVAVPELASA